MRLKCFVALCCITLLAVGWFIPLAGCTVNTQEPVDRTVDDAAEREVTSSYANDRPYISIREAARRQWCKDRGLIGQSSTYQVQPIGSAVHTSDAGIEWCDTSIASGSFDSH